jgi:hypothetical protein
MCTVACKDLAFYIEVLLGFDIDLEGYKFISVSSKKYVIGEFVRIGEINENSG